MTLGKFRVIWWGWRSWAFGYHKAWTYNRGWLTPKAAIDLGPLEIMRGK